MSLIIIVPKFINFYERLTFLTDGCTDKIAEYLLYDKDKCILLKFSSYQSKCMFIREPFQKFLWWIHEQIFHVCQDCPILNLSFSSYS